MYKIIIADDEQNIREGLAELVDWKELGFEILDTFDDGEAVIECLDDMPVDVVLTDIMMTHIGGIDVARYVHENKIPCKVVFISGHKDFDFALSAIKYGVEDYILKPSKIEEVRTIFTKIRKELDLKSKEKEFRSKVERRWEELHPILEEKFLSSLIMGGLPERKDIERKMQMLYPEIDAQNCPCILINLEIEDYEAFIRDKWNYGSEEFDEAVRNFVVLYQGIGGFHMIYKHKGRIRLLAIMKERCDSDLENKRLCECEAESFAKQFAEVFGVGVLMREKRVFENIYQVPQWREELIKKDVEEDDAKLLLQEQKKLLLSNIMQGNISTAQKLMSSILKSLIGKDMRYCRHVLVDILSCINEFLREKNPNLFQMIEPFIDYQNILNMTSVAEMEVYCECIFDQMKSEESMADQFDKTALVNQIKAYVQEHIYEDITLESVADAVFLSITHMRRIFKKQTGETFLQYVIKKKMQKAAELLQDPQYKVYQVGEMLGYKTTQYFSKVFYRFMGCYPGQYRKDVLKLEDVSNEE